MVNINEKLPLSKELGLKIRTIREKKEKTQEEVAHDAGLDYSFYNQIENGKRNPSIESVEAIAAALGIPLKELF